MADLPLIQLPMPEEEAKTLQTGISLTPNWDKNGKIFYTDENGEVVKQKLNPYKYLTNSLRAIKSNLGNKLLSIGQERSKPYYAPFEDINEQYKKGVIDSNELVRLSQGRLNQEIEDADKYQRGENIRGSIGSLLSGASFHPIFNIPYVGTGIGGAMYDLGQGIVEGDNAGELWDRAKRGFAIGETVGAIPYVGKGLSKTKVGQAVTGKVGNALKPIGDKITNSKLYDILMTDVKAFNPNKQIVYHGSPYDFNKFSNEAIGTGEGAQAHGMGHYTALNKNVADNRYRKRLTTSSKEEVLIDNKYKPLYEEAEKKYDNLLNNLYKQKQNGEITEEVYQNAIDNSKEAVEVDNILSAWQNEVASLKGKKLTPNEGQLYKLSVPKDNVMLREDALMSNQPNMSNLWDEIRLDRVNKLTTSLPKFKMALGANDIDINKTFNTNYFNDALEMVKNDPEKYKDLFLKDMTGRELYGYLENVLGSRKAATEYLQQRGIKGISYNGGIDGEARVIFNPDDIDIVRKFYTKEGALEYLKRMNPNIGSEAVAIGNGLVDKNYWKQYAKDNSNIL